MFLKSITSAALVLAIIITLTGGTWMAQPWGDNYAYQSLWGYLGLAAMMIWAISPYVYSLKSNDKHNQGNVEPWVDIIKSLGLIVICLGGVAIVVDTSLINLDPQGALIFIFLPVYQWVLIALLAGFERLFQSSEL